MKKQGHFPVEDALVRLWSIVTRISSPRLQKNEIDATTCLSIGNTE